MKDLVFILIWTFSLTQFLCNANQCRSKFGVFTPDAFDYHACAWCYYFLYPAYVFKPNPQHYLVVSTNGSHFPAQTKVVPDIRNATSVNSICSSLTPDECNRWKLCCSESTDCCKRQQRSHGSDANNTCVPTWDGYGCWETGVPGRTSHISCPNFLQFAVPTRSAVKVCRSDGQWLKKDGRDWTDYTPCLNYKELRISIYISLGCQIASLLCLVPSVVIFINYRSLIHQHRIRLHLNFFISFIFSGIFIILWNTVVTYDRITNTDVSDTLLFKNSSEDVDEENDGVDGDDVDERVDGEDGDGVDDAKDCEDVMAECKLLSFLKLYFTSTNYAWMFCEGLYLYRLIVNAFSPPKRLLPFYILGWGTPLLFTSTYAIVRLTVANESIFVFLRICVISTYSLEHRVRPDIKQTSLPRCWAKSIGINEWIIYTPNLFCLVVNIYILCSILRILLTQLQVHPNEPSNFRRALKATFVLIPLFGVQLVVTIYRLPPGSAGSLHYERFSEFVTNSQGMCVALIFCLCNGEVSAQMKHSLRRRRETQYLGSKKDHSGTSFNNTNHTLTTRYNSTTEKASPNRSLILCYKKGNGETTSV